MFAEKILRKHVSIIHAYSNMSALQRKIVNVLLYEALNKNGHFNCDNSVVIECSMPFFKFSRLINFRSKNTQYLKEAIDGLASLKIEWNLLKDKVPTNISFINLRILHGSPTFYKNGSFNFSFHKLMLNLVGNPIIYGSIDLDIQSQFVSRYGHSLYENSTRFVNLKKDKIISLDIFRKMLGVREDKYPSARELMRNVIKTSIEEVNDCANFVVNLDSIKSGRKITGFELSVTNKKKTSLLERKIEPSKQIEIQQLIKLAFGEVSVSILNNILEDYPQDYILEKITYTKKHARKEQTGLYPIAYFISALRDDYKDIGQLVDDIEKKQPNAIDQTHYDWEEKLNLLFNDLNAWKRNLEYAKTSKNPSLEEIKKIILQCEEKLQQHFLERKNFELKEKAG